MARVDTDSRKRGKEEEKRMTSNKVMRLMYDMKELLTQGIASMTGAPPLSLSFSLSLSLSLSLSPSLSL